MVARVMIGGQWRPIAEARMLLNHPGHRDQKSHGRKGGGATGQAALDAAPAQFTMGSHYGDREGGRLDAPAGAGSAEALAGYHGRDYDAVNGVLRTSASTGMPLERISREATRTQIAEIDKTMEVSPLTSDVQVDRVVMDGAAVFGSDWYGHESITTMEQAAAAHERWKAGERPDLTGMSWREPAYVSTTADSRVAKIIGDAKATQPDQRGGPGAERVIMTITVPKGTGAVRLSGLDSGAGPTTEAELLLEHGLTMMVTADHGIGADGYRHLDVEASRG